MDRLHDSRAPAPRRLSVLQIKNVFSSVVTALLSLTPGRPSLPVESLRPKRTH